MSDWISTWSNVLLRFSSVLFQYLFQILFEVDFVLLTQCRRWHKLLNQFCKVSPYNIINVNILINLKLIKLDPLIFIGWGISLSGVANKKITIDLGVLLGLPLLPKFVQEMPLVDHSQMLTTHRRYIFEMGAERRDRDSSVGTDGTVLWRIRFHMIYP